MEPSQEGRDFVDSWLPLSHLFSARETVAAIFAAKTSQCLWTCPRKPVFVFLLSLNQVFGVDMF